MQGNNINRAKQFMAFSPLKGYYDLILEKEAEKTIKEKKRILSDEDYEQLMMKITKLKKGDMIYIQYYEDEMYKTKEGIVTELNPITRKIKIMHTVINVDDIYKIRKIVIE